MRNGAEHWAATSDFFFRLYLTNNVPRFTVEQLDPQNIDIAVGIWSVSFIQADKCYIP